MQHVGDEMKTARELHQEVERCRRLARAIGDPEMKAVLEKMVEELEAKVAKAQRHARSSSSDHPARADDASGD
jgi:hypothetical protein